MNRTDLLASAAGGLKTTSRLVNQATESLLRTPLSRVAGCHLAILEYRGRRTGQPRRLVVHATRAGRSIRIAVGRPERKTWWRNFETPHPLRIRLDRCDLEAIGVAVRTADALHVIATITAPVDPLPGATDGL